MRITNEDRNRDTMGLVGLTPRPWVVWTVSGSGNGRTAIASTHDTRAEARATARRWRGPGVATIIERYHLGA